MRVVPWWWGSGFVGGGGDHKAVINARSSNGINRDGHVLKIIHTVNLSAEVNYDSRYFFYLYPN